MLKELIDLLNKKTDSLGYLVGFNKNSITKLEKQVEDLNSRLAYFEDKEKQDKEKAELEEAEELYRYHNGYYDG